MQCRLPTRESEWAITTRKGKTNGQIGKLTFYSESHNCYSCSLFQPPSSKWESRLKSYLGTGLLPISPITQKVLGPIRRGNKNLLGEISVPTNAMAKIRGGNQAGRVGPTVGRAKTGPGQNWPGFFGPRF